VEGHLLSWIVFLPVIGMILVLLTPNPRSVRYVSVATTVATFFVSLLMFQGFIGPDEGAVFGARYGALHFVERANWITAGNFKIEYFLGADGLNFPLVILTTLIAMLAAVASWNIEKAPKAYHALFLLLETGMLGVFLALDFFLFYIFWEVMLLPMYFLIGVWGAPSRREAGVIRGGPYAAIKFFLYTLLGSILMLVVMLAFYFKSADALGGAGTFDLIAMATSEQIQQAFNDPTALFLGAKFGLVMFIFLYVAFAIKVPVFPFHTWLPDAHVEAPTPISMILAGVLLKMGAYGLFRISVPILPEYATYCAVGLAVLGLINIIYGALCAMAQTDFKKLVAYSSISHMGYVLLGLAAMTEAGFNGAMFQVLAHGISSPMCFFLVGVIYDRAHHRDINRFGGLWLTMPSYGSLATLGFFASLGLPGLCGFIGEVYVLLGTYQSSVLGAYAKPFAIIAALGAILTAGYILWMIQRVYLGGQRDEYAAFPDTTGREVFVLVPMAVLAIFLGVLPQYTFDLMDGTLRNILAIFG